ncbi:MAG TPA: alpha-1,2-fucosyltransferase [Cyclobacteriaceae bacterium]
MISFISIIKIHISFMIIQRLRGGLGNQLFQYAAGKALAEIHDTSYKLDLYYYKKHPYRTFDLENFNIPIEIATRKEVHSFTGQNPVARFLNKYENYFHCPKVFVQPHYHYYNHFLKLPNNLYLSGYWQSEKYFIRIRDKVLNWFTLKHPLDKRNTDLIEKMKTNQSISVHVRLGDYTHKNYNEFFGEMDSSYFSKAIQIMLDKVKDPAFYIFSEDLQWCKERLNLPETSVFISHNKGRESYKDLILMSACKNNIIANSTFSWWGAWLNPNKDKVVIAPAKWFQQDYMTKRTPSFPTRLYINSDLYPDDWIII